MSREFSNSILNLSSRLEEMEKDDDASLNDLKYNQEAYLKILKVEHLGIWIELICEEEGGPSDFASSPSS